MEKYWVAGHITGVFEICDTISDTLYQGSRGAGFSINRGVITWVEESDDNKDHIFFDNKEIKITDAKVSFSVVNLFRQYFISKKPKLNIYHSFEIPLSSGFGASAAGALGVCYALSSFFDLGLSKKELFQIAHIAEVTEGGGLGDIIGLFRGGWELRIKPGAPYIGQTRELMEDQPLKIATISKGPIKTSEVIRNQKIKEQLNFAGKIALEKLTNRPTVSEFAKQIEFFTDNSGLKTEDVETISSDIKKETPSVFIGQIMLGNGLIILFNKEDEVKNIPDLVIETLCKDTVRIIK